MDGHLRRRRIMQRMGSVDKIKKLDVIAESPSLRADFESILGKYC